MDSKGVKDILLNMGAVLCNIASVDRFAEAPAGAHPLDVLPSCKSVVVFAKQFASSTLSCKTAIPYTIIRNLLVSKVDHISSDFCDIMEQHGIGAVPTGASNPSFWDTGTGRYRNIVSAKHCAQAAGMGRIGKNSLLQTPEYGNMIWLSAILLDAELEPDELLQGDPCPPNCNICVDNCPANALSSPVIDQRACIDYAFRVTEGDDFIFKCHKCRSMCPHCFGSKNKHMDKRMMPDF